jgi:hypothetical protein
MVGWQSLWHEGFGRAGLGSPHPAPGARTGSRFRPGRKIRLRVPPGEVVPIGTPLAAELGGVGSTAAPAPDVVPRAEGGRVRGGPGPQPVPGPFHRIWSLMQLERQLRPEVYRRRGGYLDRRRTPATDA